MEWWGVLVSVVSILSSASAIILGWVNRKSSTTKDTEKNVEEETEFKVDVKYIRSSLDKVSDKLEKIVESQKSLEMRVLTLEIITGLKEVKKHV